ncbi:MAG: DUF3052 family protein [Gemmatimonadetes bacterium]|nr:DUF3052 family protein [Gemmatimonadota bacterium]
MGAGYSGTPLARKLGIQPGMGVLVVDPPDDYWDLLGGPVEGIQLLGKNWGTADFVHLFVSSVEDLSRRLPGLRARIHPDGMIWISWPKRASGVATDLTEDRIREAALANRLVDVKVCAVDAVWSGLKLMIRRKDRR